MRRAVLLLCLLALCTSWASAVTLRRKIQRAGRTVDSQPCYPPPCGDVLQPAAQVPELHHKAAVEEPEAGALPEPEEVQPAPLPPVQRAKPAPAPAPAPKQTRAPPPAPAAPEPEPEPEEEEEEEDTGPIAPSEEERQPERAADRKALLLGEWLLKLPPAPDVPLPSVCKDCGDDPGRKRLEELHHEIKEKEAAISRQQRWAVAAVQALKTIDERRGEVNTTIGKLSEQIGKLAADKERLERKLQVGKLKRELEDAQDKLRSVADESGDLNEAKETMQRRRERLERTIEKMTAQIEALSPPVDDVDVESLLETRSRVK